MSLIIAGRFQTFPKAEAAAQRLFARGFLEEDVTLFYVAPSGQHGLTGGDHYADASAQEVSKGAGKGVTIGAVLGAIVGAALFVLFKAPWLAAVLAAGAGAYVGSLIGAMVHARSRKRAAASAATSSTSTDNRGSANAVDAFFAEFRRVDVHAPGLEHQLDRLCGGAIVFNQQYAHISPYPPNERSKD